MISSFSYFIVDTICGVIGGYNDFWMNFHHFIIFTSYADCYFHKCALQLMSTMILGEITNPFNILRKFYEYTGQKKAATNAGISFVGAFLLCRVVIAPFAIYWICLDPHMTALLKMDSALMLWVGFIWAWKIINMGLKTLTEVD